MGYKYIEEDNVYPVFFVSPLSIGKSTLINAIIGRDVAETHLNILKGQSVKAYRHCLDDQKIDLIEIPADISKDEMKSIISSCSKGLIIYMICHYLVEDEEYLREIKNVVNLNNEIKLIYVYYTKLDLLCSENEIIRKWKWILGDPKSKTPMIIPIDVDKVYEQSRRISSYISTEIKAKPSV